MKWDEEAEKALGRVPFFVRKRVKKRVEEEARTKKAKTVTKDHMTACRETVFNRHGTGSEGIRDRDLFRRRQMPQPGVSCEGSSRKNGSCSSRKRLKKRFLKEKVNGPLKMHHEFRVSLSDCPNGCSRPQIADFGLLGAEKPSVSEAPCSGCGACVKVCRENAVTLHGGKRYGSMNPNAWPAGSASRYAPPEPLHRERKGIASFWAVSWEGTPRLGKEQPSIYTAGQVLEALDRSLDHYKSFSVCGGTVWRDPGAGTLLLQAFLRKAKSSWICGPDRWPRPK